MCPWVHVSGWKAPLVRPVGLFGRGLSVDRALLLVPVDSKASASENVAWVEGAETSGFFTFFFLLALRGKSSQSVFVISKTCYNMPNINLCLPPFLKEKETLGASCCVQWLWPCEWSQEDLPKGAIYLASVNSGSVSERVGSERNLSSPEELIAADTLKRGKERK